MTMVERVEAAILAKIDSMYGMIHFNANGEIGRAAIEAMREPTVQMTQAACDATRGPVPMSPEAAHSVGYRAMIDAALKVSEGRG